MLRRLLKARGLETMQFSAQVLYSEKMTTAIERQQNLPPHKGDISYGRLIKKTKMLKNIKI